MDDETISVLDSEAIAESFLWNEFWDSKTQRIAALPVKRSARTLNQVIPVGKKGPQLKQLGSTDAAALSLSDLETEAFREAVDCCIEECRKNLAQLNRATPDFFYSRIRCEARYGRASLDTEESTAVKMDDENPDATFPGAEHQMLVEGLEQLSTSCPHGISFVETASVGIFFPVLPEKLVSAYIRSAQQALNKYKPRIKAKQTEVEEEKEEKLEEKKKKDDKNAPRIQDISFAVGPPDVEVALQLPASDVVWTVTSVRGSSWCRLRSRRVLVSMTCPSVLQVECVVQLVLIEELYSRETMPVDVEKTLDLVNIASQPQFYASTESRILTRTMYMHRKLFMHEAACATFLKELGPQRVLNTAEFFATTSITDFYATRTISDSSEGGVSTQGQMISLSSTRTLTSFGMSSSLAVEKGLEAFARDRASSNDTVNANPSFHLLLEQLALGAIAALPCLKIPKGVMGKRQTFYSRPMAQNAYEQLLAIRQGTLSSSVEASLRLYITGLTSNIHAVPQLDSARMCALTASSHMSCPFDRIPLHLAAHFSQGNADVVIRNNGTELLVKQAGHKKQNEELQLSRPFTIDSESLVSVFTTSCALKPSSSKHSFALQLLYNRFSHEAPAVELVKDSFGRSVGSHVTILGQGDDVPRIFMRLNLFDAKDVFSKIISAQDFADAAEFYLGRAKKDCESGNTLIDPSSKIFVEIGKSFEIEMSVYKDCSLNWAPSPTTKIKDDEVPTTNNEVPESHLLEVLRDSILPQCVDGAKAVSAAIGEPVSSSSTSLSATMLNDILVCVDDYYLVDGKTTYLSRKVYKFYTRSTCVIEESKFEFHWFLPAAFSHGKFVHHTNSPIDIAALVGSRLHSLLCSKENVTAVAQKMAVQGEIQSNMAQTSKIFNSSGLSASFLRGNDLAMLLVEAAVASRDDQTIAMACEDCSLWLTKLNQMGMHTADDLIELHDNGATTKVFRECGIPTELQHSLFIADESFSASQQTGGKARKRLPYRRQLDFAATLPADSVLSMPSRSVIELACGGQLVPVILPRTLFFAGHGDFMLGDVVLVGRATTALVDNCVKKFASHNVFESSELIVVVRDESGHPLSVGLRTIDREDPLWQRPENMQFVPVRNSVGKSSTYFMASKREIRTPTEFELSQLQGKELFSKPRLGEAMFKDGKVMCFHRGPGMHDLVHEGLMMCKPSRVMKIAAARR